MKDSPHRITGEVRVEGMVSLGLKGPGTGILFPR